MLGAACASASAGFFGASDSWSRTCIGVGLLDSILKNLDACRATCFLQRGVESCQRRSVADGHIQIRRVVCRKIVLPRQGKNVAHGLGKRLSIFENAQALKQLDKSPRFRLPDSLAPFANQ